MGQSPYVSSVSTRYRYRYDLDGRENLVPRCDEQGLCLAVGNARGFGCANTCRGSINRWSDIKEAETAFTGPGTTGFSGTGTAAPMGRITTDGHATVTGSDGSCAGGLANVNVEVLTAANGDTLTVTSDDVACPIGAGRYNGTGHWQVTGGTGRFSGTSGFGSLDGSLDFNARPFTVDLTGSITMESP